MFEEKEARATATPTPFDEVLSLIMAERLNQQKRLGKQDDISRERWLTTMMEELGEASRTTNQVRANEPRDEVMSAFEELVQLGAIVFRALEVWGRIP